MKKIESIAVALVLSMALSSCATVMNLDNNKSLKMGFDLVTEKADAVSVTVDGKPARYYRLYEGHNYYVDRVILKKAKLRMIVTVTQNGVTKTAKLYGEKAKGLFWCSGLFVLIDHATGTLRQYPALVFEDMAQESALK